MQDADVAVRVGGGDDGHVGEVREGVVAGADRTESVFHFVAVGRAAVVRVRILGMGAVEELLEIGESVEVIVPASVIHQWIGAVEDLPGVGQAVLVGVAVAVFNPVAFEHLKGFLEGPLERQAEVVFTAGADDHAVGSRRTDWCLFVLGAALFGVHVARGLRGLGVAL